MDLIADQVFETYPPGHAGRRTRYISCPREV